MDGQTFNYLWLIPLVPILFLVFFALIWFLVVWLISLLSGWYGLSQRYRTSQTPAGKKVAARYAFVNGARYGGNALNITTNDFGLFLETSAWFSLNHERLFIPWNELHSPEYMTFRNVELVKVQLGKPPMASLSLPITVFQEGAGRKLLPSSS